MGINRLRKSEKCPIHGSYFCCGRERKKTAVIKGHTKHGPVTRIPDETNPRGYREICTKAELKRRKDIKIREQEGRCAICGEEFTDYRDIVPEHILPKGMGGAFRDDHISNIQAAHSGCNTEKGSIRNYKPPVAVEETL